MTKQLRLFFCLMVLSGLSYAQSIGTGKAVQLQEILPQTTWVMRIIEVGPTRDFYGSITHITINSDQTLHYTRQLHLVRGSYQHAVSSQQGTITLFGVDFPYSIKGNTLYYTYNKKEVALLRKIARPAELPTQNETPKTATDNNDAILSWLQQNSSEHPTSIPKDPTQSDLAGSYWQLLDYTNPMITTNIAKEMQWKLKKNVFFSFMKDGLITLEATDEATGELHIGDLRATTIILSYTDTGWNRVIGRDRLIRLELETAEGKKILYHMVSDDGRSIYPATIRRMGDDEPSYAYINRTHVLSRIPNPVVNVEG